MPHLILRSALIAAAFAIALPNARADEPDPGAIPPDTRPHMSNTEQKDDEAARAAAIDMPVTFDRYVVDLGEIDDDLEPSYAFRFTNTTDKVVELNLLNYCRQCTKPEIQPGRVRPGATGVVILHLETRGKAGPVRNIATIGTDGSFARAELVLRATVRKRVGLDQEAWHFGDVRTGSSPSTQVHIVGRGESVTATAIESETQNFIMELAGSKVETVEGREHTILTFNLSVAPTASLGPQRDTMRITTDKGVFTLPVSATILGSLRADPPAVDVSKVYAFTPVTGEFVVHHRDGDALQIKSISVSDPEIPLRRGVTHVIESLDGVTITTTRESDGRKLRVKLETIAPEHDGLYEMHIRLQGITPDQFVDVPFRFLVVD